MHRLLRRAQYGFSAGVHRDAASYGFWHAHCIVERLQSRHSRVDTHTNPVTIPSKVGGPPLDLPVAEAGGFLALRPAPLVLVVVVVGAGAVVLDDPLDRSIEVERLRLILRDATAAVTWLQVRRSAGLGLALPRVAEAARWQRLASARVALRRVAPWQAAVWAQCTQRPRA